MLALLALAVSAQGHAAQNVGGGSAAVCRDSNNAIVRDELIDIFDGIYRLGLTIPDSPVDPDQQVKTALTSGWEGKRYRDLSAYIANVYANVRASSVFLPDGIAIQTSNDLGADNPVLIPDGCHLEQVGYYDSKGRLSIASNVYNNLSGTGQAGFWLHETLYKLTREIAGATDSALARKLVAELLSPSFGNPSYQPRGAVQDVADALKLMAFDKSRPQQFISLQASQGAEFKIDFTEVLCEDGKAFASTVSRSGLVRHYSTYGAVRELTTFGANEDPEEIVQDISIHSATNCILGFEIFYNGKSIYKENPQRGELDHPTYLFHIGWLSDSKGH
ncbi:MAG: hypothetical protein NTZ90_00605 [Proteobacteria bacterium]|nr:hypothetical protein [Pseudomonadota bacterium]